MRLVFGDHLQVDPGGPPAEPAPGDALVRTTCLAIDPIDLARPPRGVPGRFGVGVVEGGPRELIGLRVLIRGPRACGECDLCRRGLREHCRAGVNPGADERDGCFQTICSIPTPCLVRLPKGLTDDAAVFAPLVARAIHAASRIRVDARPYVTILGDDAQSLVCAQHMSRMNASVRVVGQQSQRFTLCEKWGVRHRHADDVGRRADQDVVLVGSGVRSAMDLAPRLVRPRGRIVLLPSALLSPHEPLDLALLISREIELVGVESGPMDEALALLARGDFDVASLIERRLSLRDGAQAWAIASRPASLHVLMDAA